MFYYYKPLVKLLNSVRTEHLNFISKLLQRKNILSISCFILIINLYFGNILKLPMSNIYALTTESKINNFITHKKNGDAQLLNAIEKLQVTFGDSPFYIAVIKWEREGNIKQNYTVKADYVTVVTWDGELKKMVDATPLMGNNGVHKPHDLKSSKSILENDFEGGRGSYKDFKNYAISGGTNVNIMLQNYPFKTEKIAGATYNEGIDDIHRVRFVVIISEEAAAKVSDTDKIVQIVEELRDNYMKVVKSY